MNPVKLETERRSFHRRQEDRLLAEQLQEAEAQFRALFEEAPLAYHEIDRLGIVQRINRAACRLLGLNRSDVLGKPIWQIVSSEEPEKGREAVRRKIAGEQPLAALERDYVRRDGVKLTLEVHETLIRNAQGHPAGLRSALLDITERKRAQEGLANKASELARSQTELERFAFVVSHDLQEPLRMVAGYTQLLARRYKGKLDADADDFILFAVEGANRAQELLQDLLAYSRVITQGKPPAPTSGMAAFQAACANLAMAIEESGALVTCDPLPTVTADAAQLEQVFQHLIANAIKFRSQRPCLVHVGAKRQGGDWLFWVRDNGIGIEPQFFESIFVIFRKLHSRRDYPGTGVGLPISKWIVERHGGRIWAESEPGSGSSFYFTIPATAGETQ